MTNENQKEVAQEESPFISHAKLEFKALGWADEKGFIKDDMQALICENILQLLRVFSSQGHSGTTAPYAVDVFRKLAMFKPLGPLTGEDWEWQDVSHNYDGKPVFQNKRYSQVFKHGENGKAEDIRGRVFREPDGTCYTSKDSCVQIEFPYTPTTEYVAVDYDEDDPRRKEKK